MLLNLRPLGERFLKSKIGNGHNAFFWFDCWTPFGPLIKFLGNTGPRSLRLPLDAKVSDACSEVGWLLPSPRSDNALLLHSHLTTIRLPSQASHADCFFWEVNGTKCSGFSSSSTWDALRPREETKRWTKSVWFKGAVPKMAFNMWVTCWNRLPTRQRLHAWGVIPTDECCLCSKEPESRDHLLISCDFAAVIWSAVFRRLSRQSRPFLSWAELLSWSRHASSQAPSILRKLAVQVSVYHIWRQRNNVLHNNISIPPMTIFKFIDREVRNIISGRRHRKRWQPLMLLWLG
ncbi:uncharacterized protein LOC111831895 [Capsella rubella]|uniref:uncharacterized protein LOC111831431 n=1 Tax=Capsella rubella TaxID=81985 RepID=UPI000CD4D6E4|nr:uncharacterized protein LOC111831431 [Capsella rubella]XP_023643216.1 uncharacterized protein LOC111831895 [Capsella rubella]